MTTINERAEALAKAHPVGEVLENAFLGVFNLLGRLIGLVALSASWLAFHAWTTVFVIWLAFSDGFKKSARVQPKPKAIVQPTPQPPQNGTAGLISDPRYADYSTPFGVPHGPNVHASHD